MLRLKETPEKCVTRNSDGRKCKQFCVDSRGLSLLYTEWEDSDQCSGKPLSSILEYDNAE